MTWRRRKGDQPQHWKGVYQMSHKYVYLFSEGNGKMRELLGGKSKLCAKAVFLYRTSW